MMIVVVSSSDGVLSLVVNVVVMIVIGSLN